MAGEDERLDAVPIKAAEAAAALEALKAPAQEAASAIEDAFGRAGDSLTRSLARAAADGEVTLAELARAVLNAVNSAAGTGAGSNGGLSGAIQAALSSFGGARADGGPVLGGGAYLVGERGPEVFRPTTGGEIGPASGGAVTVNVTLEGGTQALLRSEAQIAQMLARAVSLGARRM
ncbi:phage tail tape measure protein [Brevundimonas sp. SORGH_AS_0993]|uniref:phage tail tape measure protein n=1 Tax=Brevundimonas sp. SORGH_AS_0993 TaxID=3041794 RepID=UPI0027857D79|nr:phage tail tape measure protein [Brevundimonas sp. SORGH_AS_0993]MDQ1155405.1 phage-related minor tail protein [Brevundimonas sp. SORGH_AS_0993]